MFHPFSFVVGILGIIATVTVVEAAVVIQPRQASDVSNLETMPSIVDTISPAPSTTARSRSAGPLTPPATALPSSSISGPGSLPTSGILPPPINQSSTLSVITSSSSGSTSSSGSISSGSSGTASAPSNPPNNGSGAGSIVFGSTGMVSVSAGIVAIIVGGWTIGF